MAILERGPGGSGSRRALRLEAHAASGLLDPGEPVLENILDAARALEAAGFNGRAL
jgi:hypothetical protein